MKTLLLFITFCLLLIPLQSAYANDSVGLSFGEDAVAINVHLPFDSMPISYGFTLNGSYDYIFHELTDEIFSLSEERYYSFGIGVSTTTLKFVRPYVYTEYYSDIGKSKHGITSSGGLAFGDFSNGGLSLDIGYRGGLDQFQIGFLYSLQGPR